MSLLDQLWDDTVAGPRPDSGLGKLRKNPTFTFRSNKESGDSVTVTDDPMKVTRSIMIVKPPQGVPDGSTPPISPAGSTPPVSPFAGSVGRENYRFRRKSLSDAYEKANRIGPGSPRPPYDL